MGIEDRSFGKDSLSGHCRRTWGRGQLGRSWGVAGRLEEAEEPRLLVLESSLECKLGGGSKPSWEVRVVTYFETERFVPETWWFPNGFAFSGTHSSTVSQGIRIVDLSGAWGQLLGSWGGSGDLCCKPEAEEVTGTAVPVRGLAYSVHVST